MLVPPGNAKIRKAYVCVGSCGEKRSLEEKHYTHVDFQEFAKKEDKATSATLNCAMQMPEVEVGVARFSDLTSQANNEGELVYRRADWECLVHQRGLSSAGGLFYFFLRFMGALIFLIGAVRFFNLASPAALLTLVGRNKTPDKPLELFHEPFPERLPSRPPAGGGKPDRQPPVAVRAGRDPDP
ncbi:hypothetical protein P4129_26010 [Pseudomonas aeruginosa]|nr:hypothetical protein [Pseudomonas aeruginosa]